MKRLIVLLLLVTTLSSQGQNSILQTMIKQIALLQTYIGYIEKGYDIARKGLNTIADIKDGHLKMDIGFFNSLKKVNPKIAGYSKVAAILQLQDEIFRRCRELKRLPVNENEVPYIARVTGFLLDETETVSGLLEMLIKDGELTMSDDERIKVINQAYDNISGQYHFISSFLNETKSLLIQRLKEKSDVQALQELINIQP